MQIAVVRNLIAAALMCLVALASADPLAGKWVLEADQSSIRGGLRVSIELRDGAFRYSSGGVEYSALFDGDDYPIRGLSSRATVSLQRVSERSIQRTYKRDGEVVSIAEMTVSLDGRFLSVKIKRIEGASPIREWVNTYARDSGGGGKDPFAGIWDRNPIRSMGNSLSMIVFEALGEGGLRLAADQVEYSAKPDGQEHKVIGTIVADSVSLSRIDSRTLKEHWKENGKVVATVLRTVSADGARMTATVTGVTPQGDSFENVFVYRRN